jgi:hypothetical protein
MLVVFKIIERGAGGKSCFHPCILFRPDTQTVVPIHKFDLRVERRG